MTIEIESVLADFNSESWETRERSVDRLSVLDHPGLPLRVHAAAADAYGSILFCRYLEKTRNPAGLPFLEKLCVSADREIQVVALEALKSFPAKPLTPVLERLFESGVPAAVMAALKIVEDHRIYRLTPVLMRLLAGGHPRVLIEALRAVRKMGEDESAPDVLALLKHDDALVIREAVITLLSFSERRYWRHFSNLLAHPSSTVRRTAVWAASRSGQSEALHAILRALDRETVADVRQEALKRLSPFDRPEIIDYLTREAIESGELSVRNMSRWYLNGFPPRSRFMRYKSLYGHARDDSVGAGILDLMGRLGSAESNAFLLTVLRESPSDRLRLAAADALGHGGTVECLPALEPFIARQDLMGYTALLSIGRIAVRYKRDGIFTEFLDRPESENEILIQAVLQFLQERVTKTQFGGGMWASLIRLTRSANINLAYLSAGLLAHHPDPAIVRHLLDRALEHESEDFRHICADSMAAQFRRNPAAVAAFLDDLDRLARNTLSLGFALDVLRRLQEQPGLTGAMLERLLTISSFPESAAHRPVIGAILTARAAKGGLDLFGLFLPFLRSDDPAIHFELLLDILRRRKVVLPAAIVQQLVRARGRLPDSLVLAYLGDCEFEDGVDPLFEFYDPSGPPEFQAALRAIIRGRALAA